jgi:hypothetical protein
VTDDSQPATPQPGEQPDDGTSRPQHPADLPRLQAPGESLPQRGESPFQRGESSGSLSDRLPQRSPFEPLPRRGDTNPNPSEAAAPRRDTIAPGGDTLPRLRDALVALGDVESVDPHAGRVEAPPAARAPADDTLPQRGATFAPNGDLPTRREAFTHQSDELPRRGDPFLQRTGPADGPDVLPRRTGPADGPDALPRRTTRTRPVGRHRSPHRLSVSSDAPALVLAVPGSAAADTAEIGPRVASIASRSCPGVDIRVGYVEGSDLALSEWLAPADAGAVEEDQFPKVIVPLLLGPSPNIDAALRRMAGQPEVLAVVAGHLGPHPLVAEALHARLAEAGLARHARASGLSIAMDGRGVIVLADKDEQAASAAAVAAVLLASRLSVPVVPASLGDPASIADAVTRLSESGSRRPALAPCLIGPETSLPVLDDLSAALGAPAAATLGAHQAVGQLVAIRYGAALASLSLAG